MYTRREKPLGVLQFEGTSNKLGSWIIINQAGYYYFLIYCKYYTMKYNFK